MRKETHLSMAGLMSGLGFRVVPQAYSNSRSVTPWRARLKAISQCPPADFTSALSVAAANWLAFSNAPLYSEVGDWGDSIQPPRPPRRRQHVADLDERQRHALSQDRRQRTFHECPGSRRWLRWTLRRRRLFAGRLARLAIPTQLNQRRCDWIRCRGRSNLCPACMATG